MKKSLLIILLTMLFNVSFPQGIDPLVNITLRVKASELKVGNSLPNWGVIPLDERKCIPLSEFYKEEMILIEFWFTNCYYCILSIPQLNRLHSKYEGQGLKILFLNPIFDDEDQSINKFIETHKISFDVYRFGNIFEGSLPTFILVDRNGIIRYKADGYPKDLTGDIEKIMAQLRF